MQTKTTSQKICDYFSRKREEKRMKDSPYFTAKQVADVFGVYTSSIGRWVQEGLLVPEKTEPQMLFLKKNIYRILSDATNYEF